MVYKLHKMSISIFKNLVVETTKIVILVYIEIEWFFYKIPILTGACKIVYLNLIHIKI